MRHYNPSVHSQKGMVIEYMHESLSDQIKADAREAYFARGRKGVVVLAIIAAMISLVALVGFFAQQGTRRRPATTPNDDGKINPFIFTPSRADTVYMAALFGAIKALECQRQSQAMDSSDDAHTKHAQLLLTLKSRDSLDQFIREVCRPDTPIVLVPPIKGDR